MHVWLSREQKVIQLLINLEYSLYTMLEKQNIKVTKIKHYSLLLCELCQKRRIAFTVFKKLCDE